MFGMHAYEYATSGAEKLSLCCALLKCYLCYLEKTSRKQFDLNRAN